MHTDLSARRPRPTARAARVFALVAVPLLLLTSCKISDVTDPVADFFGLSKNEIATPKFEIVNGITIQVIVKLDDIHAGIPITVRLRCAGGTELSDTVTVTDTGSLAVGDVSFKPTWPAGTDCLVSQQIVQGVDTVVGVLTWIDSNDVKATFTNT